MNLYEQEALYICESKLSWADRDQIAGADEAWQALDLCNS